MLTNHLREDNLPLSPEELAICQTAFDTTCHTLKIEKDTPEARRLAVYAFELYRQGIRDPQELAQLAGIAVQQY